MCLAWNHHSTPGEYCYPTDANYKPTEPFRISAHLSRIIGIVKYCNCLTCTHARLPYIARASVCFAIDFILYICNILKAKTSFCVSSLKL